MATAAADQVSYDDLYARWERSNWRATEIDFAVDREHWRTGFSDLERRAALWNYSMFFHGEDAVTDDLSPFIDAAPREEQKYFLATQQVDEARHAVFFNRFMHEVVERGDGTIAGALEATRPELTWGFRKTFAMLHKVVDELRRDRSRAKLAQAVTMYHLVVEATLAQPGQHFISDYLDTRDLLPGFRAGMRNVASDEQRHIAFGVKLLRELAAGDPEVREAVADQLRTVTPYSLAVFVPPGWDTRYVECFGFTLEQIYEVGARSFESRFRAAGLPIESLPGPQIMPMDKPPRERAERGLAMLRAGYLGERNGPPARDPAAMAILFDSMRRGVDLRRAPAEPLVLQWEFSDAEPWHLRLENGASAAAPGRAPHVDIELRCRFDDWVDVIAGRLDPRKALATGRLRPRGKPRALWRARGLLTAS
jgi:Ribonucleotide reductase, small chain/SCP-2 sterol transfer family